VKLIWVLGVFILVIVAVFLPAIKIFSHLVYGAQEARLYSEARLIATTATSLSSEGSAATLEVSIPSGNIIIGKGYVIARTGRGDSRRFDANVDGSLTLGEGEHMLELRYVGSKVEVALQ
jgi:hypothetical protein